MVSRSFFDCSFSLHFSVILQSFSQSFFCVLFLPFFIRYLPSIYLSSFFSLHYYSVLSCHFSFLLQYFSLPLSSCVSLFQSFLFIFSCFFNCSGLIILSKSFSDDGYRDVVQYARMGVARSFIHDTWRYKCFSHMHFSLIQSFSVVTPFLQSFIFLQVCVSCVRILYYGISLSFWVYV